MIDCQLLVILREVDRMGSLTAAADRLGVSQPALSHTIRKFEDRLGLRLWAREGRGLRFTQAGDYLLAVAQRVLPQLDHAERVMGDFATGQRGTLRMGMECHPCQKWLMRLTAPYLAAWPDVDFDLTTAFRFGGIAALTSHQIDLLITPDPVDLPGLIYVPVFDYELVLAVPKDHPLAQQPFACPADLTTETLITFPVTLERLDVYTRFLVPGHCRPRRHSTAETTDLMLELVAAGRGLCVLPDWLLREEGSHLPVHPVRLGKDGIHKTIHLGLRRGDESIGYIVGFLDLAKAGQ